MDEKKRDILKSVFWDMHEISKRTETKTVKEYTETADENGNIVVTETEVLKTVLYISVKHTSVDEMKTKYGFNNDQKAQLDELLTEDKPICGAMFCTDSEAMILSVWRDLSSAISADSRTGVGMALRAA